jgi:hypothetical protein
LHPFARLFEDYLKGVLKPSHFLGVRLAVMTNVLDFLVGHFVDLDLTGLHLVSELQGATPPWVGGARVMFADSELTRKHIRIIFPTLGATGRFSRLVATVNNSLKGEASFLA